MGDVERQVQATAATWQTLESHGVTSATPLVVDLFWYAKDHATAEALAQHLRTGVAHFTETKPVMDQWSVTAQTKPRGFTLDALEQLVRDMHALGEKYQCEFDGWGAQMPDGAKKKPWWQFW